MELINQTAFKSYIASVAREVYLEENADKAGVSKKELKEMVRMFVQQRAFNREQAAHYIGKSKSTVDRLVKTGRLAVTTNGTLKYFRREDLDEFIDSGITTKEVV